MADITNVEVAAADWWVDSEIVLQPGDVIYVYPTGSVSVDGVNNIPPEGSGNPFDNDPSTGPNNCMPPGAQGDIRPDCLSMVFREEGSGAPEDVVYDAYRTAPGPWSVTYRGTVAVRAWFIVNDLSAFRTNNSGTIHLAIQVNALPPETPTIVTTALLVNNQPVNKITVS